MTLSLIDKKKANNIVRLFRSSIILIAKVTIFNISITIKNVRANMTSLKKI